MLGVFAAISTALLIVIVVTNFLTIITYTLTSYNYMKMYDEFFDKFPLIQKMTKREFYNVVKGFHFTNSDNAIKLRSILECYSNLKYKWLLKYISFPTILQTTDSRYYKLSTYNTTWLIISTLLESMFWLPTLLYMKLVSLTVPNTIGLEEKKSVLSSEGEQPKTESEKINNIYK